MAGIRVVTPPSVEPVTLDDVKGQLGYELDDTSPDSKITPLIPAAREWCEKYQNRAYVTQTLELALDCWPYGRAITLLRPPLQAVDSLITIDSEDEATTWPSSNYVADTFSFVGRLVRARGVSWPPGTLQTVNGIRVTYIAGYGTASAVPNTIKQAIIMLTAFWFENGVCPPPDGILALLNLERVIPV